MKIGIISDIHVDINQDYDVLKTLDRVAKEEHCELVLIAGDIHNNAYQSIESIAVLNRFGNVSYRYVPGNHDLWNDHIRNRRFNGTKGNTLGRIGNETENNQHVCHG